MKSAVLCLMLLPACGFFEPTYEPATYKYALTWYCISPEGCERAQDVAVIDRATEIGYDITLTSTQDPSFEVEGSLIYLDSSPRVCLWVYYLELFGHELEPSRLCHNAGGVELELSIPNEDPATYSKWVVSGRK
jgi:hypothetical protein